MDNMMAENQVIKVSGKAEDKDFRNFLLSKASYNKSVTLTGSQ